MMGMVKLPKKKENKSLVLKGKKEIIKLEISEEYKKELSEIREEVKKGKFTKYKDIQQLSKDLGL
ncbi:MAG: hypothetical protein PQ964_08290 [Methanobacteriaceae archaeon]|jgi:hypothetical protein